MSNPGPLSVLGKNEPKLPEQSLHSTSCRKNPYQTASLSAVNNPNRLARRNVVDAVFRLWPSITSIPLYADERWRISPHINILSLSYNVTIKMKMLGRSQYVFFTRIGLVRRGSVAVTPSWSGDKFAYYSDTTGRYELCVIRLVPRHVCQITNGEAPSVLRAGFVRAWENAC